MKLTIRRPDDFHRHLREGDTLRFTCQHIGPFARAVCMPNTQQPVVSGADVERYRTEIRATAPRGFTPLMTVKLVRQTSAEVLKRAKEAGAVAVKYYPEGVTTNSEDGIPAREFGKLDWLFSTCDRLQLPLLVHGEHDETELISDRERDFLPVLRDAATSFPRLRFVLEHITTLGAVALVESLPDNVAATITPHHLRITQRDVLPGGCLVHNLCMPIAKREEDRRALVSAATSGNPKFFLGTDDAPHPLDRKRADRVAAGVCTGGYALAHYAEAFERADALGKLDAFASEHGARFYGLPLNEGTVTLERGDFRIETGDGLPVRFFMGGQPITWRVAG